MPVKKLFNLIKPLYLTTNYQETQGMENELNDTLQKQLTNPEYNTFYRINDPVFPINQWCGGKGGGAVIQ